MAHHHHHSHAGHDCHSGVTDRRRLIIAFFVISIFMVVEVIGGIISGSLALLADAGHMATDSVALLLAIVAKWLAEAKTKSNRFPFGFQRAQVLAGFLNGLGLFLLVGWLVWEAIHRMANPTEIMTGTMLVVAVLGLGANIVAFMVLHGGNTDDLNMRGAMLHVLSDIFGSVAAILSAIIIALTGYVLVDALLTLVVCALVLRSAWPLLNEAAYVLLQGAPESLEPEEIKSAMCEAIPDILDVHEIRIWMLTPEEPQLAMHIKVGNPARIQPVLEEAKKILKERFNIEQSTVQVECTECPDAVLDDTHSHHPDGHDQDGTNNLVSQPS
jgi:cobalt-zinc-cadmium efflux system protein